MTSSGGRREEQKPTRKKEMLSTAKHVLRRAARPSVRCFSELASLPEEHKMIQEMCRTFADEELVPNAHKWDKTSEYPAEQMQKIAELGLMGIATPEEMGGSGLGDNFSNTFYVTALNFLFTTKNGRLLGVRHCNGRDFTRLCVMWRNHVCPKLALQRPH